jgi:3-oxoadipate enol-lactonase
MASSPRFDAEHPFHWSHGAQDGPLLLCLHGIGSTADAFVAQRSLAQRCGRHVVAWDAPGYGRSADPAEPLTLDGWADAAAGLIRSLGYDRAVVIGVSWGGVTATRLTLRHPGLVEALILADSSVGSGTTPDQASAMLSRAEGFAAMGVEEFAANRAPLLVSPSASPEVVEEARRLLVEGMRMPSYGWACASMAEADHRRDLPTITIPTLVVVGEDDTVTGVAAAKVLADGIPGARMATIAGAGHLANQEKPEIFNDLVADFLDSLGDQS